MGRSVLISLALAALLLPGAAFAGVLSDASGRLNGAFFLRDADQPDGSNEGCVLALNEQFVVVGQVSGSANGCDVDIVYFTPTPHKFNATALKGSKTSGSVKLSQSIFSAVFIDITDPGDSCSDEGEGDVEDAEKCKVSGAAKGSLVSEDNDATDGGRLSVACDLGENGANVDTDPETVGIQPPTQGQLDTMVAAFADRKDVKIDSKGRLKIRTKGVPDDTPFCPL